MFNIVPYRDELQQDITRLMEAAPSKALIWRWQFEENPFGYSFDPVVLIDDDRVVGFNGVMAVDVRYNNRPSSMLWSCDFYVNRDYRGKGLGREIKNALHKKSDMMMSFGISNLAAPVLLKMGWRSSDEVCVFRKYRSVHSPRQVLASLVQHFNALRGRAARRRGHDIECRLSDKLPDSESVDALWERAGPGYRKIVVRNYAYLHWRYEQHPLASYRFVQVLDNGELRAIGVLRHGSGSMHLVDMLAFADDLPARNAIVAAMLDSCPDCAGFVCSTSDSLLFSCLQDHGFFRARLQPRFFVYSADAADTDCERGWFVMGGDSDGDLLAAAREHDAVHIQVINDPAEFSAMETDWRKLLDRSDANPLFMSWAWQFSWWDTWGECLGLQLYLLVARRGDRLVGIAPLYLDRVVFAGRLPVNRLQFIGNAFRRRGTVRTEYMEFISERESADEVCKAFANHIAASSRWDEIVLCDVLRATPTSRAMQAAGKRKGWLVFVRLMDRGVRVVTTGNFKDYLAGLGKHTRMKLFNRRKYLDSLGRVEMGHAESDTLDDFFSILNRFHRERWGKDCFGGESLHFHKQFLQRHVNDSGYDFNRISVDGRPISIIYNVRAADTVFNLQSGFDAHFDSKLSPGMLHMGMAIEEAFSDSEVKAFDLLAGRGKNQFYKSHFNGETVEFITLQLVRRRLLKLIYRIYLLIPDGFRERHKRGQGVLHE
jgi:GNAT superfamily N-acetyltransferase